MLYVTSPGICVIRRCVLRTNANGAVKSWRAPFTGRRAKKVYYSLAREAPRSSGRSRSGCGIVRIICGSKIQTRVDPFPSRPIDEVRSRDHARDLPMRSTCWRASNESSDMKRGGRAMRYVTTADLWNYVVFLYNSTPVGSEDAPLFFGMRGLHA